MIGLSRSCALPCASLQPSGWLLQNLDEQRASPCEPHVAAPARVVRLSPDSLASSAAVGVGSLNPCSLPCVQPAHWQGLLSGCCCLSACVCVWVLFVWYCCWSGVCRHTPLNTTCMCALHQLLHSCGCDVQERAELRGLLPKHALSGSLCCAHSVTCCSTTVPVSRLAAAT